ncbi:MAG: 4-hydroxy-tetrahydrodipicolinate synthase [Puniceicoccales bacterium]|jgi:4-hydroxy-tetrahydrodipicolinate synthase|nr:4-hydroxy-tetrahydrodipicolinate synthase [Puniceicoccales bacterium]
MDKNLPRGTVTALATPFTADGDRIDFPSLDRLLQFQLDRCVSALVVAGTTGEGSTLAHGEYAQLLVHVRQFVHGRVPIYAATGSYCTKACVERTQLAESLGVDGVLIVAPYYNKPTQRGIFSHFSAIADAVHLPIILYSIKSRCAVAIEVDTICELYEKYPHICALKECESDCFARISRLRIALGNQFRLYCGNDELLLPFLSIGGDGAISAASNSFIGEMKALCDDAFLQNFHSAAERHWKLFPWFQLLSCETNPSPIKFMLHLRGLFTNPTIRLPLVELSPENKRRMENVHKSANATANL